MVLGAPVRSYVVKSYRLEDLANAIKRGRETVVTLNVAHLRMLADSSDFRTSYSTASIITLDSQFLNTYFFDRKLTVASGADLIRHISQTAVLSGLRTLLIGNLDETIARRVLPGSTVEVLRPSFGFIGKPDEIASIVQACRTAAPDVIFIAVGAPQSECLARHLREGGVDQASIVCCGAAFEFVAGLQSRSPALLQKLGLEWFWRMSTNPKRLVRRYLQDASFIWRHRKQYLRLKRTSRLVLGEAVFDFRP